MSYSVIFNAILEHKLIERVNPVIGAVLDWKRTIKID